MANKSLFKTLVGKLLPKTDAVNAAGRAGLRLFAQAGTGTIRRHRLPEPDVLRVRR